jgi:hypothetical protein
MRPCLVSLWLGLFTVGAVAQQPMFKLAGTVVDAVTGAALPNSEVQVSPVGKPQFLESAMADAAGHFEFGNLFAGKYSLSAAHAGYLQETFQQHGQYSTAVAVGPNLNTTDISFPLSRQAMVSGTITDGDGEPVPNAVIHLLRETVVDGVRATRIAGNVGTNSEGRYSLGKLPAGTYYLAVTAQPWYAQQFMAMDGHAEAQTASKLDAAYPLTFYPGVTSDTSASPIRLQVGAAMELNLTIAAVAAAHVTFERVNGANVNAQLLSSTRWAYPFRVGAMFFQRDGQSFSVAPGRYHLTSRWRDKAGTHSVNRILEVNGNMTVDPHAMESERHITATVVGIDSAAQSRLASSLTLRDLSTLQVWRPVNAEHGVVWPATELGSNRYEVLFNNPDDYYIQGIEGTNATVAGNSIQLKEAGPVQLKITLAKGKAEMKGRVEQNGAPVSGAMVLLLRDDYFNSPSLIHRDQSDSDGTFTLPGIVPGRYTLLALPINPDLEYAKPEAMQPLLAHGKKVIIEPGRQYGEVAELFQP